MRHNCRQVVSNRSKAFLVARKSLIQPLYFVLPVCAKRAVRFEETRAISRLNKAATHAACAFAKPSDISVNTCHRPVGLRTLDALFCRLAGEVFIVGFRVVSGLVD